MAQNIYDFQEFFENYAKFNRCINGLDGAAEWSTIVRMLPPLNGANVLDLGCGYGYFSRYARQNGAAQVLGIDISNKMLQKARSMTQDRAITFEKEDLEAIQLQEDTYDLVYSGLTFHYVENLPRLIGSIYKTLKPSGHFVFSAEHPIYTAPKDPNWIMEKDEKQNSLSEDSYLEEGSRVSNWLIKGIIKQHRLLSTYLNTLIDAGFVIKHVEEFGNTSEQMTKSLHGNEKFMFILVSAQKSA